MAATPRCALRFGCVGGRTTQDGTPYLGLREVHAETGLVFHLLPRGNWAIDVRTRSVVNGPAWLVLTLGTAEEDLRLELPPGGSFAMPEILIQEMPQGQPHLAAPVLHTFLQDRFSSSARPALPVVYNTWFDQFEVLELPRPASAVAGSQATGVRSLCG